MSRIHIARVALVVSALAAGALTLAADRGESTPRGGGDAAAAAEPEPETVRPCRTAVFGEPRPGWRKRAVVAGRLALTPLKPYFKRGLKFFQSEAELKVLAVVDAGARVTLAVPEAERRRLSLLGGLFVRGAHCVAIEVWTEGRRDPRRRWLPFGIRDGRCRPARA